MAITLNTLLFVSLFASSLAHSARNELPRRSIPETPSSNINVEHLFRRQDQKTYPAEDVPGPAPLAVWTTAYNAAKTAGLIPGFAPARLVNGSPAYANGAGDPQSETSICSWTVGKCDPDDDIVDAPDGMVGISFDDGPQAPTATLLPFLHAQGQHATHFMIGSRILDNTGLFDQTVKVNQDHISVHTWSHPYMTTLTDAQVLGEIGWTMQIIYDRSGFVPAFWRPPYGDVDNRVRAIARHVFGLTTVIWNQDTDDWCLADSNPNGSACPAGEGPGNYQALLQELQGWYNGPKSPGLIILEHELSTRAVQAFIETYPLLKSRGWDGRTIPDLTGAPWYQNAASSNSTPVPVPNILAVPSSVMASASPSAGAGALVTGSAASGAVNATFTQPGASASASNSRAAPSASSVSSGAGRVVVGGLMGLVGVVVGFML